METERDAAARAGLTLPSPRHRWWTYPLVGLGFVTLAALSVLAVAPSSLVATARDEPAPYARTPSSALPVDERISLGEIEEVAEYYPADGDFYFVTITEPSQSVLSWLVGRDNPAVQFLTHEDKYGTQTPDQRRTFALEQMLTSSQTAQFVALQRVGYDVDLVPGDVLIQEMVCLEMNDDATACAAWSPSDEVLDPGDRILEVEGESIDGVEDLSRLLEDRSSGDLITMRIDRPGTGELEVDVELTSAPDEPDRTIIGFYPFDTRRVELPFELDIDTGRIGGPSAGLAFTLTLIDELTPGELTGGGGVAVTGAIELDGTVGAIGGLRQKASAVAQAGVELFLVPAAQSEADLAAARDAGGDGLEIVPVANLEEALDALAARGGDPIP